MAIGKVMNKAFKLPPRASVKAPPLPQEPEGVPPHYDFNKIYESWLWMQVNDPKAKAVSGRRRGVFSPSSGLHPDSGLCERALIFGLLCAPFSASAVLTKICKTMNNGTNRHAGFQADMDKLAAAKFMGVVGHTKELECAHHTLPIYGHADGLITMRDGWRYLYDLKTQSVAMCAKTFEPKWEHRVQLNTYMGLYGVRMGYVIYENKDNQDWLTPLERFRVPFDAKLYAQTEQFCAGILREVKKKRLPMFDAEVCKKNLMFCAYQEVCLKQRSNDGLPWEEFDCRSDETRQAHKGAV